MAVLKAADLSVSYLLLGRQWKHQDPIVLVHGLAASLGFWFLRIAPALARQQHVLIFDLRGHGRTSTPLSGYRPEGLAGDLRALLDRLGVERAHLVGHSYGGAVATSFACAHPERVKSLTLADTRLHTLQPTIDSTRWAAWPRYRAMLNEIGVDFEDGQGDFGVELFWRLARLRLERPAAMERLRQILPSPFVGPGGDNAARRWLRLLETTTARADFAAGDMISVDRLRRLDIPTLLLYGEHSQALPSGHALRETLPESRLEIVPRAGHFFPASMPNRLIEPLEEFVGGLHRSSGAEMADRQWLDRAPN